MFYGDRKSSFYERRWDIGIRVWFGQNWSKMLQMLEKIEEGGIIGVDVGNVFSHVSDFWSFW